MELSLVYVITELNDKPGATKSFQAKLIKLRQTARLSPALNSFKSVLDGLIEDDKTPHFLQLRKIQDSIRELELRAKIELKIVRSLQTEMEQNT